jgi:co-chaperonin GroES (HSP10)
MIEPLLHRLVIKPRELEEEDKVFAQAKKAGLVFDVGREYEMEKNKIDVGTVVAVGPTAFHAFAREANKSVEEVGVKAGDVVSFAKYAGKIQFEGDQKYVVLNDEDVVARLS